MQPINRSILRWSYGILRRIYCSASKIGNGDSGHSGGQLGKLPDRRLYLRFKCGPCGLSVEKWLSKQAYDHGVIIVTCDGCKNRHLIADNLGWFPDVDRKKLPKVQEVMMENFASAQDDPAEPSGSETKQK
ncbi:DNL-type zinc finger protein-like [Tropilaelaps mercedesae]|uniref:DNL-type zinc finger protein-like n=1 Tax=Tropilaelaps mercedesae TaxID=418985 RepID=A0A1V9XWP4_9ACAR|nr:DNL-type zinc finger protein-like [Tropilaelaps mercedesae]